MRLAPSLLLTVLLLAAPASAQRLGVLPIDDPYHHVLERARVLGLVAGPELGARPLSAAEARALAEAALDADDGRLGRADRRLLERITGAADGPGAARAHRLLPPLYADGEAFASVAGEDFAFEASPLAYLAAGPARVTDRPEREAPSVAWQNTRGVRVAGRLGPHVFFESRLEENQRRDPWVLHTLVTEPERGRVVTAPRLGHVKLQDGAVYDYWTATGVVGVRSGFFEARFGRDRHRWGHGAASLVLSNYPTSYDHLQLRTRVWRLHYTNLFARFTDPLRGPSGSDTVYPSKYFAGHRLAVELPAHLQLELFEHVVISGEDGRGLDLGYLNPILFYRALEVDLGSPDNVLLGTGLSWRAAPGVELYGQFILTEFQAQRIGTDWWGNKFGYLAGVYLVDPGWGRHRVRGLDVRVEAAWLRPYLYSHRALGTTFVHHDDPVGHPAGQNAQDLAVLARYRTAAGVEAALNLALTRRGRDTETENWGGDPRRPYSTRVRDTGVVTLQGVRQDQLLLEGYLAAEVLPRLYVEGALRVEQVRDAEWGTDRYAVPQLSLRWGVPFRSARY